MKSPQRLLGARTCNNSPLGWPAPHLNDNNPILHYTKKPSVNQRTVFCELRLRQNLLLFVYRL